MNDGDQEGVSITETTISSSQLTVIFTSDEAGVYSCVTVNAFGHDSRSFQVNTAGESNGLILLIKSFSSS